MPPRLSNKDVAALNVAMTVLLTPFSNETGEGWRRAVCTAFEGPLRAVASALMSFIDAAPIGLLILNTEGGVLRENGSAVRLFAADPERRRLRAEIERIAVRVACLVTCPGKGDWMNEPVLAEIRTAVARYRITATFLGEGWFGSSATVVALVDRITPRPLDAQQLASQFRLTGREIEAAQLLKRGYSGRQIAATLGISVNTARRHTEHVLSKLDVHSRAAVISRLDGH
jgi:DNA-binding CsgD family transcriptional regulator